MATEDGRDTDAGTGTGTGNGVGTDTLGYEQARDELIDVVRRLETGGSSLEESLELWERGEELARVCRRWLDGARARLDAALAAQEPDREPGREPGRERESTPEGADGPVR